MIRRRLALEVSQAWQPRRRQDSLRGNRSRLPAGAYRGLRMAEGKVPQPEPREHDRRAGCPVSPGTRCGGTPEDSGPGPSGSADTSPHRQAGARQVAPGSLASGDQWTRLRSGPYSDDRRGTVRAPCPGDRDCLCCRASWSRTIDPEAGRQTTPLDTPEVVSRSLRGET